MDPLHPIIPVPVNIPPVMPAPSAGRISREQRERARQQPKDKEGPECSEDRLYDERSEEERSEEDLPPRSRTYDYEPEDEPDDGSHIDVTV